MDRAMEYQPLESGSPPTSIGRRLRAELREAPLRQRIVLPIYLLISGVGGLYGGCALTSAYSNWLTWSVALLIVEPVGVASLLALWIMVFPDSRLTGFFDRALGRAWLAAILVGLVVTGVMVWALLVLFLEWWRVQSGGGITAP
jgi:hypothetical protein